MSSAAHSKAIWRDSALGADMHQPTPIYLAALTCGSCDAMPLDSMPCKSVTTSNSIEWTDATKNKRDTATKAE
jgi:hypothetical protein